METMKICPNCRKPLPPDVPLGLCPECLIKAGFPTGTEPGAAAEAAGARFVPPPVAEIAQLFPQLEILRLIGKGGMGAVYKARQPTLDRFVALKVLPPAFASDPGFAERFNREARALARLNHPNIVAVHDFGKAGPLHYLVMEFVDGANLREVERFGELTPEQALAIVPQICEALQFAHNEGIVHRDIKPENLLLDKKGRLKITDFGIAKMVGVGAGQQTLTGAKDIVGTPHYMAPEQIEKPLTVDHRADIYSLGVVFYEMLTGELPLGKFAPPSRKVHIDVRLDEVVLHALEKEPERRYQHASQVKTAVEEIAGTPPPAAAPTELLAELLARDYQLNISRCVRRGWALVRKNFWPLVGISAFVTVVLAGASSSGFVISNGHSEGSTSILGILLAGPLLGGLFLYFLKTIRGEAASVETAFTGFRQPLPHLVLAAFVTALLIVLGFLCLILPGIYLLVAWKFTYALIVDKGLDFWTAMRVSRKVITKHWWKFFGLVIVCALINLAGLLALIVGIFITSPITFAALMYAYEDILGAVKIPSGGSPSIAPVATPVPPVVPSVGSGVPRAFPANRSPFRRGVLAGLSVFVLIVIAASIITFLLPKVYVGDTRVRVLSPPPLQYYNPYLVQNEFQVIQSTVVPKVAASLNLAERWGKEYAGGHTLTDLETYNLMLRSLDLEPVRNTIFIDIRFYSRSPTEASEIANKIAETYCALPPDHRGEIVRLAEPASRPVRPNVPKNIFAGVLAGGVVGILTGLAVGLFSFWRLRAAQFELPPPAQKPDRFWRRFAITVLALIILIPASIYILAILLPIGAHFAFNRNTQEQEQPVNESIRSDFIGQAWFPQGDSIEITSVERTKNQMTVKGYYDLVSHDNALLALYVTTMQKISVPVGPNETMQIPKGRGEFELIDPNPVPGLPHVSMYGADGHPFASLYFGNKAEAQEENKANWISNASPVSSESASPTRRQVSAALEDTNANRPKVIFVSPADGTTNVNARQEIRIRFDQPMNPNGLALQWIQGGFQPDGQPRYKPDQNEFIIPVWLAPGQTNELLINFGSGAFGGFHGTNAALAQTYRWHFNTQPLATKPGAAQPKVVRISPKPGETLSVLTMLKITFDQPMVSPGQSPPYLRIVGWGGWGLPAFIPSFDYDPASRTFTVPVLLPPDNETRLTLEGFKSADGVASEPVVVSCQVGTNNYSSEQLDRIASAAKDPRLEELLSSMTTARTQLTSGVETVQSLSLFGQKESLDSEILSHWATFKWQGTNQAYADISDAMGMGKAFILGTDGNTCWLYSEGEHNERRLDSAPTATVADIYTSVADPFGLTRRTVESAVAKERLIYEGQTQLEGRLCYRVQSWMVRQSQNEPSGVSATKSEWWIDAETFLPAQVVHYGTYGCETFRFRYERLNQPLPDAAFQPPVEPGVEFKSSDWFERKLGPDDKRFLTIKDGCDGQMSGRLGVRGPGGSTSSGLN